MYIYLYLFTQLHNYNLLCLRTIFLSSAAALKHNNCPPNAKDSPFAKKRNLKYESDWNPRTERRSNIDLHKLSLIDHAKPIVRRISSELLVLASGISPIVVATA